MTEPAESRPGDREKELLELNASLREQLGRLESEIASRDRQMAGEAQRRSNEFLQHFAHMAAHDLQSPVFAIAGCIQLLQEECAGRLGDPAETYMGLVLENTRRLQTLVGDFLAYCRAGAETCPVETVDLGRIFDEAVFSLAKPIADAGAEVLCAELPCLHADRAQMAQLLRHLIDNAVKFRQAGRPVRISVWAERRETEWVFGVRDNGIGIAPRYHEEMFDIFRRLHSYQAYPGSGLGLSICRRIVERHGGRIWVESAEGEGSTFYFTLPADAGEAP
jgi:light-regulated signal transduction histidine kinase (bacteriophytochrome)